MLAKRVRNSLT